MQSLSCGLMCIIQFSICFFKGASTYKYHAPAQTVQNSIYYGRFSLGLDYNASFSSFADEDFSIPSDLPTLVMISEL